MRFVCLLLAAAALHAAAEPIPVEQFFRLPQYADMKISPDGRRIAALAPHKGRQNLFVIDVGSENGRPVTSAEITDVVRFEWLSDRRLLFWTGALAERVEAARPSGFHAVDSDGSLPVNLLAGSGDPMARRDIMGGTLRAMARPVFLVRTLPGDGEEIIVQEAGVDSEGKWTAGNLFRVATRSGRRTSIGLGKPDTGETERWVVDDKGVARGFSAYRRGRAAHYFRAGEDADWIKIDEHSLASPGGLQLLAVDDEGRGLYVGARKDRDTAAVYRWSPESRSLDAPVAAHPRLDLDNVVLDEGKVVGVMHEGDRRGWAWFDAKLARVQQAADRALPGRVNRISWSRDRMRFVVHSSSDLSPGSFHFLDLATGNLKWLADRAPWIDPARMAPMRPVRYPASDGLEIPAYLTLPPGAPPKGLPMVVLVHGGPWVRGATWSYDPEVQFLASRGYAVLQPNFRGTLRYGWKHFSASFRQWGLAMQDDVADGVSWAVAQGYADPKRVCIYGGSYGGYAAMMGLAKTPDLYRCGINYVGVTDIRTMLTVSWSDFAYSDFIDYLGKELMGDARRDAAALDAVSPVKLAARIKAPVLMAYGGLDRRVPLVHGNMMKSALDAAGKRYEWMLMEGEGHGFRDPANQRAFYEAVEKFLAEHLAAQ